MDNIWEQENQLWLEYDRSPSYVEADLVLKKIRKLPQNLLLVELADYINKTGWQYDGYLSQYRLLLFELEPGDRGKAIYLPFIKDNMGIGITHLAYNNFVCEIKNG